MSGGGKGGQSYISGYWYGLGMHMALCHSVTRQDQPLELTEVMVGDKVAWAGRVNLAGQVGNEASIRINQRGLFGGEGREGGLDGTLDVQFGGVAGGGGSSPNAYLQSKLGADVPTFKGVVSVVWHGLVAAMNPYIKPWRFRLTRLPVFPLGGAFYSTPNAYGDANPANIIAECLGNDQWGLGLSGGMGDFMGAALKLRAEEFGLSLLWSQEIPVEEFILSILRHIDGVLFVSPLTGYFELKLIRDDYNAATLPVFDTGNTLRVEEFTRPAWGELVNQVTVQYRDGPSDKDMSVTVQDIASIQRQGGVVGTTVQYPGISNAVLAQRVALRDLKQLSQPLAKVTLVVNQDGARLNIGDVFKFTWQPYGIVAMVLRVVRLSFGELTDSKIRIEAVEDVFSMPNAVYATPPSTGWVEPISFPAPCPAQWAYEVPYYQVVSEVVGEIPSILRDISPLDGMAALLGVRPSDDALAYHAWSLDTAVPADRGQGAFAPSALLGAPLPRAVSAVVVAVTAGVDLEFARLGGFAIIDEEWFKVVAVDTLGSTVSLERAVLDTVPAAHMLGARIYFVLPHFVRPEYVVGEIAQFKLCPKTPRGELDIGLATLLQLPIQQRFARPYPPANVQINGAYYPQAIQGALLVTWAERNRINQTAGIVLQSTGNITPEVGQTTSLRIYDEANVLRHSYTGLTTQSLSYTQTDLMADGAPASNLLRLEIESSRTDAAGTLSSLYVQNISIDRAGYGLNYGKYYGGI